MKFAPRTRFSSANLIIELASFSAGGMRDQGFRSRRVSASFTARPSASTATR